MTPNREAIIQDKIHLLMEETGCDQGQAELAMTSAGYDLEKAIRTIGTLLRNIVVVRGKFSIPEKNLYGLLILIADVKRRALFRGRAVVSYNPAIFETPLSLDWYDFERRLYTFRLWEGTLQQMTQDLERSMVDRLEKTDGDGFFDDLRPGDESKLRERLNAALENLFSGQRISLETSLQELNLDQFKRLPTAGGGPAPSSGSDLLNEQGQGGSVSLRVDLEENAAGVPASDVQVGDSVFAMITDERDIAQYLSKLLGGRQGEGLKSLPAPVEECRSEGDMLSFQVRLSSGILGLARMKSTDRLRVQKLDSPSWWKKIWNGF